MSHISITLDNGWKPPSHYKGTATDEEVRGWRVDTKDGGTKGHCDEGGHGGGMDTLISSG